MTRSIWKGPFIAPHLIEKAKKLEESGKSGVIKTRSRSSSIPPKLIGITIAVYNGKKYVPVLITADMVGKKLGEFAPTRNHPGYSNTDKKGKR